MIRRVLMTADPLGGTWTYALELSRALAEHDVSVLLAVMGPAPTPERRLAAERIPNLQIEHKAFALEWMDHPWADVRLAGEWLLALEAKWKPDVIHLNGYSHATCGFRAPRLVAAHSCVCSWHEAVRGGPAPEKWATYRKRVTAGLAAADAVVAPTRWMLKALEQHYGKQLRGEVIANVRSPEGFAPGRKDPVVFGVGRLWDEAKNLLALDLAAETLDWPVMIAGASDSKERPQGTYQHTGLLGELGPDGLSEWMARSSIFALPARYEPFGLSVMEAALSGCALVLGDIPSLRETWSDAAVFVNPEDPAALSNELSRLIAQPAVRKNLALRAEERARTFSPRAQAAAYLATYESLTARVQRPAWAS